MLVFAYVFKFYFMNFISAALNLELSLSLKDNNSTTKNFNVRKQYSED
jgi:hypothetical protein